MDADALVRRLTPQEKHSLVQGIGWNEYRLQRGYYVGSIAQIDRLGIPAVHMQDAGQGFRTQEADQTGQTTAWPSMLSVAATWDAALVRRWGEALGEEFRAKGANVILGPGVQVHRVPRGGRNAEYLSGEDPYLGALLVPSYVRGVQSKGVAAVAKHFALNSQETNRNTQSSDASDRTLWEVYYPPFEAAVEAGAAAVMCSYNLINGTHACGSTKLLQHDLKAKMRFGGFVVSDWWATHAASAARGGVDQEMPGTHVGTGGNFFTAANVGASGSTLDDMAARVLRGMRASGAFDEPAGEGCTLGGGCNDWLYHREADTPRHVRLARELGAAGTVLLKNRGGVLPLSPSSRVTLVGSACQAEPLFSGGSQQQWDSGDLYVVGGSGRVMSDSVVKLSAALRARQNDAKLSWLKASKSDQLDAITIKRIKKASVVVACAGAPAREGTDRPNLELTEHTLLSALGEMKSRGEIDAPIVAVALSGGAFVPHPWIDGVDAALAIFLGGQETGNALADVLFGDVNPSARLPVTLPLREASVTPPCESPRCEYLEGVHVGWRGLQARNVAFAFGHGLSYTSFGYEWLRVPQWVPDTSGACGGGRGRGSRGDRGECGTLTMQVRVTNLGAVAGAEVAQLYLRFPTSAAQPDLVLRAFSKTPELDSGETADVCFALRERDLSVWDRALRDAHGSAHKGMWRLVRGAFGVLVGGGSRDIRLEETVVVPV